MGIKKREVLELVCDYCGIPIAGEFMDFEKYKCPLCGKDVCSRHCYYVYLPHSDYVYLPHRDDEKGKRICREHLG